MRSEQGAGVLERVRAVGVEEPAAVARHQLDRLPGRGQAARDELPGAGQGAVDVPAGEVLHHPEASQHRREDHRQGQQDADHRTDQVGPEISHGIGIPADQAADQGHGHAQADGRTQKRFRAQPGGLGHVTQRCLTRVVLPAGVGGEADRGIEGERRVQARVAERERQRALHPQQQVQQQDAGPGDGEDRDRVVRPGLVVVGVDAAGPVDHRLGPPVPRGREDPGQVVAQWHVQHPDEPEHHERLQPARHRRTSSLGYHRPSRPSPGTGGRSRR